jgi:hypothetical protein
MASVALPLPLLPPHTGVVPLCGTHQNLHGIEAQKQSSQGRHVVTEHERLLERMRRVEALYARTDVEGERAAAGHALQAILEQLRKFQQQDPAVEFKFALADTWTRRLFMALARRYGLEPYRYSGQRHTTVMLRVSKSFVDTTFWPEFKELSELLQSHLNLITDQIIAQSLNASGTDETVVAPGHNRALPAPVE